jgi:heme exporter protein D
MLPLAHISHYLWVLYVIPVLIVAAAIVRSTIAQRRARRELDEGPT